MNPVTTATPVPTIDFCENRTGCPRCGGAYWRSATREGDEWSCFHCGHVAYGEEHQPSRLATTPRRRDINERVRDLVVEAGRAGTTISLLALQLNTSKASISNALGALYAALLVGRTQHVPSVGGEARWYAMQTAVAS